MQAACVPPETQTYVCRKRLVEYHVNSRSAAGAVACNGARGGAQRQEALRVSAVPGRSEGICIPSALTPPKTNQAKFSASSTRRANCTSLPSTNDLNRLQANAG